MLRGWRISWANDGFTVHYVLCFLTFKNVIASHRGYIWPVLSSLLVWTNKWLPPLSLSPSFTRLFPSWEEPGYVTRPMYACLCIMLYTHTRFQYQWVEAQSTSSKHVHHKKVFTTLRSCCKLMTSTSLRLSRTSKASEVVRRTPLQKTSLLRTSFAVPMVPC